MTESDSADANSKRRLKRHRTHQQQPVAGQGALTVPGFQELTLEHPVAKNVPPATEEEWLSIRPNVGGRYYRDFKCNPPTCEGENTVTTLTDRPNTALLVIDVQNGVVTGNYHRDAVVANVSALVDKAREAEVPVIWVQHSDSGMKEGTETWDLVPELTRSESEPLVHKTFGDSFEGTDLEDVLATARVGRLIVSGAQTDACIRSTIHGAFARGYDVTLVSDAHTTEDQSEWGAPTPDLVIAHTNMYWQEQRGPGKSAEVVETKDVTFA